MDRKTTDDGKDVLEDQEVVQPIFLWHGQMPVI